MIALVFFSWMIFSQPKRVPPPAKAVVTDSFIPKTDSTGPATAAKPIAQQEMRSALFPSDTTTAASSKFIETPLVSAVISSHGGNIISWVLKNYKTFQRTPLELVDKTVKSGDVNLIFVATDGRKVSTKDLPFILDDNSQKTLGYHDSLMIRMVAKIDSGASIEKIIHIYSDKIRNAYRVSPQWLTK